MARIFGMPHAHFFTLQKYTVLVLQESVWADWARRPLPILNVIVKSLHLVIGD